MALSIKNKLKFFLSIKNIFYVALFFSSCIVPKKYQKNKPFITSNSIEVKGGKFTKDELLALKTRLYAQLDDSAKINVVDHYFIRHVYNAPPAFDTAYAGRSARNMKASMLHLGYYRASAYYKVSDTIKKRKIVISFRTGKFPFYIRTEQRVKVKYFVEPGKPTLIDTLSYHLKNTDLQQLAIANNSSSLLQQGKPITKAAVLGQINQLVEEFKDNGYYKFSGDELKLRGDTTLAALTNISDDPFEQLQLLAEAQQKKDSPKIKLAFVLNNLLDSSKLKKYYIHNIYILPDYRPGDNITDTHIIQHQTKSQYIIRYHNKLFRTSFLTRNMLLKSGDLYNQTAFYKTLNNFSGTGVWRSVNIEIEEVKDKDSSNKINLIVQLIPNKQFSFEAGVEASYSATSNTNNITAATAGNLLGLSGNVSKTNRNLGKEGIKMINAISTGIELNLKPNNTNTTSAINSNEISVSNSFIFPRFIFPFKKFNKNKHVLSTETFVSTNASYINRINLFNLQSINLGLGYSFKNKHTAQFIFKPLNIEFTKLYNQSSDFEATLSANPFLRYSFNTALVAGTSFSYISTSANATHNNQQHSIKINAEESGFPLLIPLRSLNILQKYLRQYVKADIEYTHSRTYPKSAIVFRLFGGLGIASKKDTSLPFFKQYYGGGSNSMRGWPVRGIGLGSKALSAYGTNAFNDRTGDIQLEANAEYRFDIAQLIPNTMALKGALFIDAGNVWNFRNTTTNGGTDSTQFKLKNLWKELGISAGTGFRLDFNYFVIRFDFGFRFKRPELSYINDGWKIPALGFDDVFKKIFTKGANDEYRKWRYENFNFTIGINYPF